MSVTQDLIYRRVKYERVNRSMHVYSMFLEWIRLTKRKEMHVREMIIDVKEWSNRFPWNWTISWWMNKAWTEIGRYLKCNYRLRNQNKSNVCLP